MDIARKSLIGGLAAAALAQVAIAQTNPETGPDRVNTVNPRYDLVKIRPANFQPRVTAMAFRPDGKLVVITSNQGWAAGTGAEQKSMYLLDGVHGTDPEAIKVTKINAPNLFNDVQGLIILDDGYYVSDKDKVLKLTDANGDGIFETKATVGRFKFGGTGHEFAFGPAYKDGHFYLALSVQLAGPGPSAKVQNTSERGTVIKMNATTGAYTVVADGFRTPNGIGFGPKGELFVTDNQGSWLPSCKLMNVKQGRTYGHRIDSPVPAFQHLPVSPPVVWTPHADIGRSPGEPALMTVGPYAGQMVFGDLSQGGVKRVFMEEVNGELQGAIMPLSGGLESGMHRIIVGPDGSMYLGGIGNGDLHNWGWMGTKFGLQRLKPNGKELFEILAVRSRRNGMEVEFTEPISPTFDPAKIEVLQWWYEPTYDYGCCKRQSTKRVVKDRRISPDGKSLFIEVEGLQAGWVTHIKTSTVKSRTGQNPFFTDVFYTLNAISPSSAFDNTSSRSLPGEAARLAGFRAMSLPGALSLELPSGSEVVALRDLGGRLIAERDVRAHAGKTLLWKGALPGPGAYVATVRTALGRHSMPFTSN
jgi:hypothetical protein